ncbi:ammonium transporter [Phoenicibacter congonensis]|uniref:ammonium transporter n=1 Tax=Phoenicibacter congonensis TaxID=1944646 RepID=UPI0009A69070|nr:ammonium transporter [Phoenicibacter congonensis]
MFDSGNTGFMIVCAMLVLLMTPGLAFFYGGLSRRKNVVNTMIMCFGVLGIVALTWTMFGWSFAYGGDGSIPFFGGFDQIGLFGLVGNLINEDASALSHETYPALVDVFFQMAFCMITTAIITGALAGRMKFGAICAFVAVWTIVVYPPLAHMAWGGDGSFIGDTIGALDFAGGDVVHISSGLTGLILALLLGKRKGFGVMSYRPHNVPFVALGATLLWFGWFGFNGGSQFAADGVAALAVLNTVVASGAGLVAWMTVERVRNGKPTLVGAATGLVAGLVAITPAAGFVEPWAAVLMGIIVAPICYFAVSFLKAKIGYDDALDAFGCHSVGGIIGGILTGVFCVPDLSWTDKGGLIYTGDPSLLLSQILGILVTIVFVAVADVIIGLVIKAIFKGDLRVSEEEEALGLDVSVHGESAYPAYIGLD